MYILLYHSAVHCCTVQWPILSSEVSTDTKIVGYY
jgi:hypothetical protein